MSNVTPSVYLCFFLLSNYWYLVEISIVFDALSHNLTPLTQVQTKVAQPTYNIIIKRTLFDKTYSNQWQHIRMGPKISELYAEKSARYNSYNRVRITLKFPKLIISDSQEYLHKTSWLSWTWWSHDIAMAACMHAQQSCI